MGRRYIGIENDAKRAEASRLRLRAERAGRFAQTVAAYRRQQAFETQFLKSLANAWR